jgi:hypothetical protein
MPTFSDNGHDDLDPHEVEQVGRWLQRWSAPPGDPAARTRLNAALSAELTRVTTPTQRPALAHRLRWGGLVMLAQAHFVSRFTWVVTPLVMLLGFLVSGIMLQSAAGAVNSLPLALVAPLLAAVGVAFLYGTEVDPALELQLATPISPRMLLLARLALVFSFNLLLAVGASLALAALYPALSLWQMIAAWLAPMAFLSALAFLLSVLSFDPLLSALISLLLWVALVLRTTNPALLGGALPDLLALDYRPLLFMLTLGMAALAVWLCGREERAIMHTQGGQG